MAVLERRNYQNKIKPNKRLFQRDNYEKGRRLLEKELLIDSLENFVFKREKVYLKAHQPKTQDSLLTIVFLSSVILLLGLLKVLLIIRYIMNKNLQNEAFNKQDLFIQSEN